MEKEEYSHSCIKCGKPYKDLDPEPYYCKTCLEEKRAIAAEVDKKIAARGPRKPAKSLLQEYNEAPKAHGFMIYKP